VVGSGLFVSMPQTLEFPMTTPHVTPEDAALLASWREQRSEDAFAELVQRHTGLVAATCRRVLGDGHPLFEDACQAVFLQLHRHPNRVREPHALACWLHWQARSIAGNLRRSEDRRRLRERVAAGEMETRRSAAPDQHDLIAQLDGALAALSLAQRQAVMRHYFIGEPQASAAGELGISEGAFKKRVADGLARMRSYFAQRSVTVSVVALASLLLQEAQAATSPALLQACHMAATGTASHTAQRLTQTSSIWTWTWIGASVITGTVLAGLLLLPQAPMPALSTNAENLSTPTLDLEPLVTAAVLGPIRALRTNDLNALLLTLTPERQTLSRNAWRRFAAATGSDDRFDRELQTLLGAGSVEAASLAGTLIDDLRRGLGSLAPLFNRNGSSDLGRLLALLHADLEAWSATAPANDEQALRLSATSRVAALRACDIGSMADLRQLDLEALLQRASRGMAEIVSGYRACGIDFAALLDSIAIVDLTGTGSERNATVRLVAFGKEHRISTRIRHDASGWRCTELDTLIDFLIIGALLSGVPGGSHG